MSSSRAARVGARVLRDWDEMMPRFVKVMPRDYKRVLTAQARRGGSRPRSRRSWSWSERANG